MTRICVFTNLDGRWVNLPSGPVGVNYKGPRAEHTYLRVDYLRVERRWCGDNYLRVVRSLSPCRSLTRFISVSNIVAVSSVPALGPWGYPIQGLEIYSGAEEKRPRCMRLTSQHKQRGGA